MKVDILFLVNYFWKVGVTSEGFFIFQYSFFYVLSSDVRVHDVKAPTPYENETDHPVQLAGEVFEKT